MPIADPPKRRLARRFLDYIIVGGFEVRGGGRLHKMDEDDAPHFTIRVNKTCEKFHDTFHVYVKTHAKMTGGRADSFIFDNKPYCLYDITGCLKGCARFEKF